MQLRHVSSSDYPSNLVPYDAELNTLPLSYAQLSTSVSFKHFKVVTLKKTCLIYLNIYFSFVNKASSCYMKNLCQQYSRAEKCSRFSKPTMRVQMWLQTDCLRRLLTHVFRVAGDSKSASSFPSQFYPYVRLEFVDLKSKTRANQL